MDKERRIHVGCGPKNLLPGWCNVDIRHFKGVDRVLDVTQSWPWNSVDYVYGEHFLEHLPLDGALRFLGSARQALLTTRGTLRLTTPSLEWVLSTHFTFPADEAAEISQTFAINRAFHGWGHRFLYSRAMLAQALLAAGYCRPRFCAYGESEDPTLAGLERHGGYRIASGYPSVWIVEATPDASAPSDGSFLDACEQNFLRYVASGH